MTRIRKQRRKNRRFPCGHRGLGRYCHRCDQAAELHVWAAVRGSRKPPHMRGDRRITATQAEAEANRLEHRGKAA